MNELIAQFFQKFPVLGVILAGILAAHALALFIVNLTPTPKDDAFVGKLYKFLEGLAGVVTDKAKQLPGESATSSLMLPRDSEVPDEEK
jgi:hypothetical protein